MSYIKTYNDKVRGTVEVPFGASAKGGTKSITVELPVQVNINVDTDPFDASVEECEVNMNLLTSALSETEAAELNAKENNSNKIARSIINGFFSYIRSEISQQAGELSKIVESKLIMMKELMKSAKSKRVQMENDFKRISDRYVKTFNDLNRELSNRIYETDRNAFDFMTETDKYKLRVFNNDLVSTISVFGSESSELISKIGCSITKKRVLDTINLSKMFILEQKKLEQSLKWNIINESFSGNLYSPVCYFETSRNRFQIEKRVIVPEFLESPDVQVSENDLIEKFSSGQLEWIPIGEEQRKKLQIYFDSEFARKYNSSDSHTVRVKETIRLLSDFASINVTL